MSSYAPPSSRMRQIKKDAPPPINRFAAPNVEAAIAAVAAQQKAGQAVAKEIRVAVGAVDAVIKPGPDKIFGTADDVLSVEGHKDDKGHKKHDHKAEPKVEPKKAKVEPKVEPEPEAKVEPKKVLYNQGMKKAELIAIADDNDVKVSENMTKAKILAALDAHFA